METIEQLHARLASRFPESGVTVVLNPGPAAQHSLLVPAAQGRAIAEFLRDDPEFQLDTCSNVTGIDWPEREVTEPIRRTIAEPPDPNAPPGTAPVAKVVEEKERRTVPGHLEVVYHLYSVAGGAQRRRRNSQPAIVVMPALGSHAATTGATAPRVASVVAAVVTT